MRLCVKNVHWAAAVQVVHATCAAASLLPSSVSQFHCDAAALRQADCCCTRPLHDHRVPCRDHSAIWPTFPSLQLPVQTWDVHLGSHRPSSACCCLLVVDIRATCLLPPQGPWAPPEPLDMTSVAGCSWTHLTM